MFSQPIPKNIFESKTPPHLHSQEFWRFDNRFRKFVFDFFLYYLSGQKFWFWQTFWKVVFLFLSEHGAEGFSALLLSIWTEIRFQPTFLKSFLRSPQLHSQKNRAFVNQIPKYSLFIYILKLSPPERLFLCLLRRNIYPFT